MNIDSLVEVKPNPNIPELAPGDTVKVHARIVEGDKQRIQVFQGLVLGLHHGGAGANFTVRHVSHGIGVERTFPFYSPVVQKVEIVRHGKVRRAKLFYLRGLSGKAARIKERRVDREARVKEERVDREPPVEEVDREPPVEEVDRQPPAKEEENKEL